MKKTIATLMQVMQIDNAGKVKGGFSGIKGGRSLMKVVSNAPNCSNQVCVNNSSNTQICTNAICDGSTNTSCTNGGSCAS